jgi:hypothetical protein
MKIFIIPLAAFKNIFPSITEETGLIQCIEDVCVLPFGLDPIPLNKLMLYEIDGKLFTVMCNVWYNKVMYHVDEKENE